jgi:Ca2+-binding RTX toxin-like protein
MSRIPRSTALVAGLLLLFVVPAAHASTASVSGSTLTITAGPGESNDVLLSLDGYISDTAGIAPGPGCSPWDEGTTKVDCGVGFTSVVVQLGDGDDNFQNSLGGRVGYSTVDGGPGNDVVFDTATIVARLTGGDGDDTIDGGQGNDEISGGAGNDGLSGRAGNDTIDGGPGVDAINGDTPANPRHTGNDTLLARDGERDSVACALGADSVVADAIDVVEELDCEVIDRAAADPGTPGSSELAGTVGLAKRARLSAFRKGLRGTVQFSRPASVVLTVRISAATARRVGLGRKAVTLATVRTAVLNSAAKRVTVKPSRAMAAKLGRVRRTLTATVKVVATDGDGTRTAGQQKLTLRR